jgi:choline dehydrogenase
LTSDEELIHAAGNLVTIIFHPVGTYKMGKDSMAVVDDHLRVVDASIMPTITSGNTNAPTVMITEKGSEFIKNSIATKNLKLIF